MNDSELFQLKENYCNHIIDGMDMDSLCQMAFDLLLDAYKDCTEDDIKEEILDLYDEETLSDLMPVEQVSTICPKPSDPVLIIGA
jgi:hypothetical protein